MKTVYLRGHDLIHVDQWMPCIEVFEASFDLGLISVSQPCWVFDNVWLSNRLFIVWRRWDISTGCLASEGFHPDCMHSQAEAWHVFNSSTAADQTVCPVRERGYDNVCYNLAFLTHLRFKVCYLAWTEDSAHTQDFYQKIIPRDVFSFSAYQLDNLVFATSLNEWHYVTTHWSLDQFAAVVCS